MVWRDRNLRLSEMVDALPVPDLGLLGVEAGRAGRGPPGRACSAATCGRDRRAGPGFADSSHPEILLYLKGLFLVAGDPVPLPRGALRLRPGRGGQQVRRLDRRDGLFYLASGCSPPASASSITCTASASAPESPYSDMNQLRPLRAAARSGSILYWGCVCAVLVGIAHLLWVRGTEPRLAPCAAAASPAAG